MTKGGVFTALPIHNPENVRIKSKCYPNFMQNSIDNSPDFMYNSNQLSDWRAFLC